MIDTNRRSFFCLVVAALMVSLAVAPAASARNKDIERLQLQVHGLQGQVGELRRLVEESNDELRRLNEALAEQNSFLRRGVEEQRLQQESLSSALTELKERVGQLGEQLDRQSAAFSGSTVGTTPGSQGGTPREGTRVDLPAPRELYTQAYGDFARGNFDLAIQGFEEYLRAYPSTDYSDNAQYWIGECQYGKKEYRQAVEAWDTLLREHPKSDKVPDARVKKGFALERLGRRSQALLEYRHVINRYPNTPAARLARDKLNPR